MFNYQSFNKYLQPLSGGGDASAIISDYNNLQPLITKIKKLQQSGEISSDIIDLISYYELFSEHLQKLQDPADLSSIDTLIQKYESISNQLNILEESLKGSSDSYQVSIVNVINTYKNINKKLKDLSSSKMTQQEIDTEIIKKPTIEEEIIEKESKPSKFSQFKKKYPHLVNCGILIGMGASLIVQHIAS